MDRHRALLLLAKPFPSGGVHGGHVAAVWNQQGPGYALTLHLPDERGPDDAGERPLLRAARLMARSASG